MPTSTRTRARNYVAMSPLLRKGGVHERSKSGARADKKHEMQDTISHWREVLEEECLSTTDHSRIDSGDAPFLNFGFSSRLAMSIINQTIHPYYSSHVSAIVP